MSFTASSVNVRTDSGRQPRTRRFIVVLGSLLATLAMVLAGLFAGAIAPAHADAGASLSGHVYISDGTTTRAATPSDGDVIVWEYDGQGDPPAEWGAAQFSDNNDGYWEEDNLNPDDTYVVDVEYQGSNANIPATTFQDHLSTTPYEAFGLAGGSYGAHVYSVTADTGSIADPTTLAPTHSISGLVRGNWVGSPAVQTEVDLYESMWADGSGPSWTKVSSTQSSPSGAYAFRGLTPNRIYVVGSLASPSGQWQASYYGGGTAVDATSVSQPGDTANLSPTNNWGAITGAVKYSSTHALTGATVEALDPTTFQSEAQTTTDSSGAYRLDPVQPGDYVLKFSHAGYPTQYYPGKSTPAGGDEVTVSASQTLVGYNANLTTGGTITGRVALDGNSDIGASTFSVQLCGKDKDLNWSCGVGVGSVSTNADGTFTVSGVPAGTYIIRANFVGTANFVPEYSGDVPAASIATPITLTEGRTTAVSTINLPIGATISGNVGWTTSSVDLSGIVITASLPLSDGSTLQRTMLTDTNGNYEFDQLPAGDYQVSASAISSSQKVITQYWDHENDVNRASTVNVTAGMGASAINFSLAASHSIYGYVEDRSSTPIDGVTVYLLPSYYPGETPADAYFTTVPSAIATATTDGNGYFSFPGLADGNYRVAVGSTDSTLGQYFGGVAGDANGSLPGEQVVVNGADTGLSIQVAPSGSYYGQVIDSSTHAPLTGATVSIDSARATTDDVGDFTITGLTPGSHTMTVSANGFATQTMTHLPALDPANNSAPIPSGYVNLQPASSIVGTVYGSTGAAAKSVSVDAYVKTADGDYLPAGSTAISSTSGQFTIGGLPTGNIVLRFVPSTAGAMPQYLGGAGTIEQATPVTITNPGETDSATEYLGKFSILSGSVKVAGKGVKVPFTLTPVNSRSTMSTDDPNMTDQHVYSTSTSGALSLPGVIAGSYLLTVNDSHLPGNSRSYSTYTRVVNLAENSTLNLAITLPKRVAISGHILDSEGDAPTGASGVSVYRWTGSDWIMDPSAYTSTYSTSNAYTVYVDPGQKYELAAWGNTPGGFIETFLGGGIGATDPRSQTISVGTTALTNRNVVLDDPNTITAWVEGYDGEDYVDGIATVTNLTSGWSTTLDFDAPAAQYTFPLPTLTDGDYEITFNADVDSDINGYIPDTTVDFTVVDGALDPSSVHGPAYDAGGRNDAGPGFLGTLQLPAPVLTGVDSLPQLVAGGTSPSLDQPAYEYGDTASVSIGDWTTDPGDMLRYQWLRDGVPIANATQATYATEPGDAGHEISVRLLLDEGCTPSGCISPTPGNKVVVAETAPAMVSGLTIPDPDTGGSIVGKLQVGSTVTANPGSWSTSGVSLTYQWVDGTAGGPVVVGSGSTHKLTTADAAASTFALLITAHRDGYVPNTKTYYAAGPIVPTATLTQKTAPKVGGTDAGSDNWTYQPGAYAQTGTTSTYQWLVTDYKNDPSNAPLVHLNEAMPKAEAQTGGLPDRVQLQVTTTKPGYAPLVITVLVQTGLGFGYNAPDILTPTTQVGVPIQAAQGELSEQPTPSNPADLTWTYAWARSTDGGTSWTPIAGATGQSYTPVAADIGDVVGVEGIAHVAGFAPIDSNFAQTDAPIAAIQPFQVSNPTITGLPLFGHVLTVSMAEWVPQPTTVTYQWYRTPDGTTLTKIAGATKSTYTPTSADIGKELVVKATGSKSGYTTVTATSTASDAIGAAGQIANVTAPTVTGTAVVGGKLTASAGTWDVSSTAYAYQWLVNGEPIPEATGSTYSPTAQDLYEQIGVQVTASRSGFAASDPTVSSNSPVVNLGIFSSTAAPKVTSGGKTLTTVTFGSALATTSGSWSVSGLSVSYQWQYSDTQGSTWQSIAGATSSTFDTSTEPDGVWMRVQVTGSRAGYSNTVVVSNRVVVM